MAPPALPLRGSLGEVLAAPLPELHLARRRAVLRGLMLAMGGLGGVERPELLTGLTEPAIFACNHNNAFEAVMAPAALVWLRQGRPVHFLTDWMYLHLPAVGWLLRQSEPIPVFGKPARWRLGEDHRRRARVREPVVDACVSRLAAGASLGIFPEGTRNGDPLRLRSGRRGLGEIVLRSTTPVVPVGIRFPAAERLGRPPRIGRFVLAAGEPLDFRAERAVAAGLAPGRARRAAAQQIVDRVMRELARLSGKEEEPS